MTLVAPDVELQGEMPADPEKIFETFEDIHQKTQVLEGMIESHCVETGESFDRLLVIPRGSYEPANLLTRGFGFKAHEILHACIGSYDEDEEGEMARTGEFKLGQMPTPEEVAGKDLLIIEEVCDTGHTLTFLTELLQLAGAGLVRTGVLHFKPGKNQTGFRPDWFVMETDAWIVYPWEEHEQHGKLSVVRKRLSVPQ